jgi:hypothetical protein
MAIFLGQAAKPRFFNHSPSQDKKRRSCRQTDEAQGRKASKIRCILAPFRGATLHGYLAPYAALFEWAHHLKRVTHAFLRILMIPRFIYLPT